MQLLLEGYSKSLQSRTRLMDIRNRNRDVSESPAGLRVPGCVPLELRVTFGAVVVGELQDTFTVETTVRFFLCSSGTIAVIKGKEIEGEVAGRVFCGTVDVQWRREILRVLKCGSHIPAISSIPMIYQRQTVEIMRYELKRSI